MSWLAAYRIAKGLGRVVRGPQKPRFDTTAIEYKVAIQRSTELIYQAQRNDDPFARDEAVRCVMRFLTGKPARLHKRLWLRAHRELTQASEQGPVMFQNVRDMYMGSFNPGY